jgi:hypothetical protein
MSGGHFDYLQSRLEYDVIDVIQKIVDNNNKEIPLKERDSYRDNDWYEKYPEDKLYSNYSNETIQEFKNGIEAVKKAYIYIQRIDWLLSGDDGEDSFHERLKENLEI